MKKVFIVILIGILNLVNCSAQQHSVFNTEDLSLDITSVKDSLHINLKNTTSQTIYLSLDSCRYPISLNPNFLSIQIGIDHGCFVESELKLFPLESSKSIRFSYLVKSSINEIVLFIGFVSILEKTPEKYKTNIDLKQAQKGKYKWAKVILPLCH